MSDIAVTVDGVDTFRVTVVEGTTSTTHTVVAPAEDVTRLGAGAPAEDVIAASFRFLLDREPKEAILSSFELSVIGRYFPEYESKIGGYLRR